MKNYIGLFVFSFLDVVGNIAGGASADIHLHFSFQGTKLAGSAGVGAPKLGIRLVIIKS